MIAPPKSVVAEPVNHSPSTRKVVARGSYSTPSILDALKEDVKEEQPAKTMEEADIPYSKIEIVHLFNQQELLGAWKSFVEKIDFPQLKSALMAREPRLIANAQIEYELDTELQFNRLTLDVKPKLLGHLRQYFQNESIEILFKVSDIASQQPHIPYTDAERWSSLVEKYPPLAVLKSKFGLDFEHF